ncbi:hypothetical protein EXU48_23835 [Occultella glacieicola]|uniref:Uncharacterized protein n=1 Tax=Occultella glacieicola TaxID=2518684 RepID=A0ABY2DXC9_9MICO|nr:DUF6668 family protein [Occultella glacieicola]TDE88155.1 hypothetical protein EXU48_23835 [Occultella glacieicola]
MWSPQIGGVPATDAADRLRWRDVPPGPALWCVGTHGGAGESTVALALGARTTDRTWPQTPTGTAPARVILIARTSAYGLMKAQAAARQWAAGEAGTAQLLGLVLVADAPGRLPRPLRELAQVISGGLPATWSMPWVEPWRQGETPTLDHPAVRALRAAVPNELYQP